MPAPIMPIFEPGSGLVILFSGSRSSLAGAMKKPAPEHKEEPLRLVAFRTSAGGEYHSAISMEARRLCPVGLPRVRIPCAVMFDVTNRRCVLAELSKAQGTRSGISKATLDPLGGSGKFVANFGSHFICCSPLR